MMFKKTTALALVIIIGSFLQFSIVPIGYAQDQASPEQGNQPEQNQQPIQPDQNQADQNQQPGQANQNQSPSPSGEQQAQSEQNPPPSCALLNPQGKLGGWIVTIIEEQIATPSSTATDNTSDGAIILECIRVSGAGKDCPQTPGTSQQQMCSVYKDMKDVSTCPPDSSCQRVQVFFAKSGTSLLYSYIGLIYRWAAGTIGIVCVIILIVSGLQITIAGDNSGKIDEAKERITQSLAGLALLFLSAVILYAINPNFFTL